MLTRLETCRHGPFLAGVVLLVAFEALACLLLSSEGRHSVLGGVDGLQYERYARNLVDHGVFSDAPAPPYSPSVFRSPGYPAFLAALRVVGGDSLVLVRAAQFALVAVVTVLTFLLAARVGGPLVARVAGLLCATYLPLLWFAREHLSDVLATAVLAATLLLVVESQGARHTVARFAAIGVLSALGALVRPELAGAVAVLGACVIAWPGAMTRRQAALRAAVMVAACLAALVPWTVRNHSVTDRLIPLGTASGSSLYPSVQQWKGTLSMRMDAADWDRHLARTDAIVQPIERRDAARGVPRADTEVHINDALAREARRQAGDLTPGDVLRRLPARMAYLWAVGDEPPAAARSVWHRVAQVQHVLLFGLVLVGVAAMWRSAGRPREAARRLWPLLAFAAYFSAVHLVFHVQARYTLPARPMLLILAAAGLVWLSSRARSRRAPA